MGTDTAPSVRVADEPGDLGWIVMAHGELYAREFGYDASMERLVARIVADLAAAVDDTGQSAWIAELEGRRVGCIACTRRDDGGAQLRVLLVDPAARGHGLGRTLVETCLRFAAGAAYRRIVLMTTSDQVSAARLYRDAGFTLEREFDAEEFGAVIREQWWALDL